MGRCRLRDEHEAILALIERVRRGQAPTSGLHKALEEHLAFEEREVLPRLAGYLPTATGPIRTILEDHGVIRTLLADPEPEPCVGAALDRLRRLLLGHFQKEEELILPFAQDRFCARDVGRTGCAPHPPSRGAAT